MTGRSTQEGRQEGGQKCKLEDRRVNRKVNRNINRKVGRHKDRKLDVWRDRRRCAPLVVHLKERLRFYRYFSETEVLRCLAPRLIKQVRSTLCASI